MMGLTLRFQPVLTRCRAPKPETSAGMPSLPTLFRNQFDGRNKRSYNCEVPIEDKKKKNRVYSLQIDTIETIFNVNLQL